MKHCSFYAQASRHGEVCEMAGTNPTGLHRAVGCPNPFICLVLDNIAPGFRERASCRNPRMEAHEVHEQFEPWDSLRRFSVAIRHASPMGRSGFWKTWPFGAQSESRWSAFKLLSLSCMELNLMFHIVTLPSSVKRATTPSAGQLKRRVCSWRGGSFTCEPVACPTVFQSTPVCDFTLALQSRINRRGW